MKPSALVANSYFTNANQFILGLRLRVQFAPKSTFIFQSKIYTKCVNLHTEVSNAVRTRS